MRLFVGLGNPGAKYARNRHNIGFMAMDEIARAHGFPPFRSKFQGEISEGRLGDERVALLKPGTFMNLSGNAVQEAARFYKLSPADLVVFHDEIDLAPGKLKVKQGGGHAGHNGLRSIQSHLGPDFLRVRMGVGHPGHRDAVAGYVLHDFPKADEGWLDDMLRGVADGAPDLAARAQARFLNAVAQRLSPPRPSTGTRPQAGGAPKPVTAPEPQAAPQATPQATTKPEPQAAPSPEPPPAAKPAPQAEAPRDTRSALQRLVDRFR